MKDRFLGSRREYGRSELVRNDLAPDPFSQFSQWYKDLLDSNPKDPNAVFLSTVSGDGQPSCRTMLLKEFTEDGFVFFTNYESRKGRDLRDNPKAAMLFFWPELERQVRVEGIVKELSAKDSELYFSQRPRGARIGAWASKQSSELSSREELDKLYEEYEDKFSSEEDVPRPANWGGFLLIPRRFEFWQGRTNRLHDRFTYSLVSKKWSLARLAP